MRTPDAVLKTVIETMVDHPEQVRVECTESHAAAVIDVFVNSGDVGIVLGRSGATAEAIRTLFKTMYSKLGKRLYLQIEQLPGD
jgi:predicted RNA-binding protein YlqC (UPF0109 family)